MTEVVTFERDYATWVGQARPFEKADDVGYVVSEFLWFLGTPFYPIGGLVDAKVSSVWLGAGDRPLGDEDNLDLIFKMRIFPEGRQFFEIVLRSDAGASYGGWIYGQSVEIGEEIVNAHRVIIAEADGVKERYEFHPSDGQYHLASSVDEEFKSPIIVRRMSKRSRNYRF